MIRGIIFDHDGTLVNSERVHCEVWQKLLISYQRELPESFYIHQLCGVSSLRSAEILIESFDLDLSAPQLLAQKMQSLLERLEKAPYPLMAGAIDLLNYCKSADLKISLASGASRSEIQQSISAHQFDRFFHSYFCKDDVEHGKPAPDVYLAAINALELNTEECIAIEDSRTGLNAAKAAGLKCIVLENDYNQEQDFSDADFQIASLSEAQTILNQL